MLALREIETSLASAVLTGELSGVAGYVADCDLGGERRLQIYRNHFTIALTECLAAIFPVLKALTGETFFNQCARAFATAYPPSSPVLFEYGEAFPRFLFEATRSADYAYFADIGSFEWAINHAYHADDVAAFNAADLLGVPEDRRDDLTFAFHPSSRMFASHFPILDIWRVHQNGADGRTIDLAGGGASLLVWRNGIDVIWRHLTEPEAVFVAALLDGATLAAACAQALAEEPSFQPNAVLADVIGGNALTGFFLTPLQPRGNVMHSHAQTMPANAPANPIQLVKWAFDWCGRFPMALILLMSRIGVGAVFFKSGLVKIASWQATVQLFANEYRVPLLPPELAATLGASVELSAPILLFSGLAARFGAAAMLGMTFVIEVFVYPENWAEHLTWASLLTLILTRGAGAISLDHLFARRLFGEA